MTENVVLEPITVTTGLSNNFNHTVSLPSRSSNDHDGLKNTPASVITKIDTDYAHRNEVENKQKLIRASENKLSKIELELNQTKEQLSTAKAFIAKLGEKCKEMVDFYCWKIAPIVLMRLSRHSISTQSPLSSTRVTVTTPPYAYMNSVYVN